MHRGVPFQNLQQDGRVGRKQCTPEVDTHRVFCERLFFKFPATILSKIMRYISSIFYLLLCSAGMY